MPPMEPDTEQYSFVPQLPFSNSTISATAPVISEDTISSPETAGIEPVHIFASGLVCTPVDDMFSSSRETVFERSCFLPAAQCFDSQCDDDARTDSRSRSRHDSPYQSNNNNNCPLLCGDNRHECGSRPRSNPAPPAVCHAQQQGVDNKTFFGSPCSHRQHAMNPCRPIPPIRYRTSGGSSSSIGSRSSSNSPGIKRRYSNTSHGKSSISTDEDMSTNPNTPNTPITPLTPNDARGDITNKDVTIFNFPATTYCNNSCCTTGTEKLTCECEGLDLDLDLDADDDVFCSDLSAISSTITSLPSNINASLEAVVAGVGQDSKNHQNLNLNHSSSTNLNSFSNTSDYTTASITTTTGSSSNFIAHSTLTHCHLTHLHQNEKTSDIALSQACGSTAATASDPLPALLSDALQVCEREEQQQQLGESRDTNNNTNSISSNAKPDGGLLCPSSSGSNSSPTNPELLSAALEAYESGQITPLLKHELKWVIQLRRLSQGKDEMEVSFDPPTVNQMSDAEMTRAERRRKQNRIAARKFRQKRKSVEEQLVQTIQTLRETNSCLEQKAEQLRNEKQALMEFMADHLLVCPFLSQLQLESLVIGDDTTTTSS